MESSPVLSDNEQTHAHQACARCQYGKTKCDKSLPACSRCLRKKWRCKYNSLHINHMGRNAIPTAPKENRQNSFPGVYFMDSSLFQAGQLEIPKATIPVPLHVTSILGNDIDIKRTASQFFLTIHTWLPIISKKRFYDHLLNPLLPSRADVTLLILCMKVITWLPPVQDNSTQTAIYLTAKQYLAELETKGILTIQTLQASILLSAYELGHAIYPAAYMSIGACARHAGALDIGWQGSVDTESKLNWTELEEKRRVWWAIVILERYINLGCPWRPILTSDPSSDDLLPADDEVWDGGTIAMNSLINLSSSSDLNLGRFARLAQASHLLSRVLRHISDDSTNSTLRLEEASQLESTLHALIYFTDAEGERRQLSFCCQTALSHSALMLLYSSYLSSELVMVPSSIFSDNASRKIETASQRLVTNLNELFQGNISPSGDASPLALNWTYQACATYIRLQKETGDEHTLAALKTLKTALKSSSKRWKAAAVYLQILEAREVMNIR